MSWLLLVKHANKAIKMKVIEEVLLSFLYDLNLEYLK